MYNKALPTAKAFFSIIALFHCLTFLSIAETSKDKKLNVLVIMADDLGYHDLSFQGSKHIKTPNIDKLAKEGLFFTDGHTSASVCSPSRAGFMTARYQQRFGHEANCPPGDFGMALDEYTAGQAFQSQGYKTFLLGKWHLGNTYEQYPTRRGFDEFWGLREGSRSYFYNKENDNPKSHRAIEHNGEHVSFEGFLTDRITDQAIEMVRSANKKPFFMFLSYTAPHGPLQAKQEDLDRANGDPYVALIQNMDDNIGRLMAFLEKTKVKENTVIWFLSDNGGTVNRASNVPLNGKKGILFEGGMRVPMILNHPKKTDFSTYNKMVSTLDILPTSLSMAGLKVNFPKPIDGKDLTPYLFEGNKKDPHSVLFWRKLEMKSIRKQNWKLIISEGLPPMLYDIDNDLSERHNKAEEHPEIVSQLSKQLKEWEGELLSPLWKEEKIYDFVRKYDYVRFRDAKDFVPLEDPETKRKAKRDEQNFKKMTN